MSLFTADNLRERVRNQLVKGFTNSIYENINSKAKAIINESSDQQRLFSTISKTYDIFLSHSSSDAYEVAGLKLKLEDMGYSVYIDWVEDPQLNRSRVTKDTAKILQKRMLSCESLFYAFSENSDESRWMPWELGYFDGIKGKVAVVPISNDEKSDFKGTEYLGIYPYIMTDKIANTNNVSLWVHETRSKYIIFNSWLNNNLEPIQR